MLYVYLAIGFVFFIIILIVCIHNQIMNIEKIQININEAENNINILLEKKLNLLGNISKTINTESKEKILTELPKIKNKKTEIFELINESNKLNKELDNFIEDNNYVLSDDEDNLMKDLYNTNLEINAIIDYYNLNSDLYNKTIKKPTYLFTRIIKRFDKKEKIIVEKEVEFEILKQNNNDNS
ncbi:MAG: hypothetical protein ACI4OG_00685 [Bacilli bacterium]